MRKSISWRNTPTRYGATSRLLHWATVLGLVAAVVTADQLPAPRALATGLADPQLVKHAGSGLVVFMLAVVRMGWRLNNTNPIHSYAVTNWQKQVARFVHWSIYATLILLALSGLSSLAGLSVKAQPLAAGLHARLSLLLFLLFGIHLVAAVSHRIFGVAADDNRHGVRNGSDTIQS